MPPCTRIHRRRRDSNPRDDYSPNGFQDRRLDSANDAITTTYDNPDPELTALLTDIGRIDPDLASVMRAWPTLSKQARADVLAVINASQQGQSATECK